MSVETTGTEEPGIHTQQFGTDRSVGTITLASSTPVNPSIWLPAQSSRATRPFRATQEDAAKARCCLQEERKSEERALLARREQAERDAGASAYLASHTLSNPYLAWE